MSIFYIFYTFQRFKCSKVYNKYNNFLIKYPLKTKCLTSSINLSSSVFIANNIKNYYSDNKNNIVNYKQIFLFGILCGMYKASFTHYFYNRSIYRSCMCRNEKRSVKCKICGVPLYGAHRLNIRAGSESDNSGGSCLFVLLYPHVLLLCQCITTHLPIS
jgi:hypothetical protein